MKYKIGDVVPDSWFEGKKPVSVRDLKSGTIIVLGPGPFRGTDFRNKVVRFLSENGTDHMQIDRGDREIGAVPRGLFLYEEPDEIIIEVL